jgi:hypothetical protein
MNGMDGMLGGWGPVWMIVWLLILLVVLALAIEAPMAIVVLGGLLTSTALNMAVVPSLFLHYGDHGKRKMSRHE